MNLRFNIRFRQQLPVPIFNACPYGNNYSAAHCFLLNDLVIRAICFLKNDISDLSSLISIVQAVYFIIFSAVKPAILLPTPLNRRFAWIFWCLLQFSAFCFTWNNTSLGQILLYQSENIIHYNTFFNIFGFLELQFSFMPFEYSILMV